MDILSDPAYRVFTKIAETHHVPTYVGESTHITKEACSDMSDELFADEGTREYPIHDKAHTWLAASYLKEAQSISSKVIFDYTKSRIEKAADIYGIREDVDAVFAQETILVAPEASDRNYGWIQKAADGTITGRRYPMFDAIGVEKAAGYFEQNRFKYPIPVRREIAGNIFKQGKAFGVSVSVAIQKEAGYGVPVLETLKEEITERARLTKDAEAAQAFENINVLIDAASPVELLKSAGEIEATIDSLDSLNGLRKHYNVRLMSPAETVYSMSIKQADEFVDDSLTLNKHTFSVTKLAGLGPETFSVLGDDFVAAIKHNDAFGGLSREKLAAILPTLPNPDKTLLEDHLVGLFA